MKMISMKLYKSYDVFVFERLNRPMVHESWQYGSLRDFSADFKIFLSNEQMFALDEGNSVTILVKKSVLEDKESYL